MEIHDLRDSEGRAFAFEVGSFMLGRRGVLRVLARVPQANVVSFRRREADFCEFQVDGVEFVVSEPWNDNSRYWIGPKSTGGCPQFRPQVAAVREAFKRARPVFGFLLG